MACSEPGKLHVLLVLIFLLWWTTCVHAEATNNLLKAGDTLNATDDAKICSEKGKYCMYFSSTFDDESLATLHMYDQKDDWVVWTANRDQPVDINSAVLSLDHSGELKIESQHGKKITLYSPPQAINNTVAILLDTGNFVLQQLHPNGSTIGVLWESFDFPTDTLVAGMKLGVNHKTGRKWSLVSWLSKHLPISGPFRLEWENTTKQLVIKREEKLYWAASGKELKHILGDGYPNLEFVSNENEDYITLRSSNEDLTKWTLLPSGQLIILNGGDVARVDLCYGYNIDGGCQKWENIPSCRNSGDAFESKEDYVNLDPGMKRDEENSIYGINDCQAICWSTCSCVGFTHLHENETGCTFFSEFIQGHQHASEQQPSQKYVYIITTI